MQGMPLLQYLQHINLQSLQYRRIEGSNTNLSRAGTSGFLLKVIAGP